MHKELEERLSSLDWKMFDVQAEALGLTPEELFVELHGGKSLADIAEARGVDLETVQEAMQDARAGAMTAGGRRWTALPGPS